MNVETTPQGTQDVLIGMASEKTRNYGVLSNHWGARNKYRTQKIPYDRLGMKSWPTPTNHTLKTWLLRGSKLKYNSLCSERTQKSIFYEDRRREQEDGTLGRIWAIITF